MMAEKKRECRVRVNFVPCPPFNNPYSLDRWLEVNRLLKKGHSMKEIADSFNIDQGVLELRYYLVAESLKHEMNKWVELDKWTDFDLRMLKKMELAGRHGIEPHLPE